jgi:hypothetical protein
VGRTAAIAILPKCNNMNSQKVHRKSFNYLKGDHRMSKATSKPIDTMLNGRTLSDFLKDDC